MCFYHHDTQFFERHRVKIDKNRDDVIIKIATT